jgi:hypothetical protein
MLDELRIKKMAQYSGTRIKLRGTLDGWDKWYQSHGREYRRACLVNVETDGELVAGHVWVIRAEPVAEVGAEEGDVVELTGLVKPYKRKADEGGATDYCIFYPEGVRLVNAPALVIPAKAVPAAAPVPPRPAPTPTPTPAPAPPPPARNPLAAIRPARDFLKVADAARAVEVLQAAARLLDKAGGPDEAVKVLQEMLD